MADALPQLGAAIWGVAYRLSELDIDNLDRCEGYQPGRPASTNDYCRRECQILLDGDNRQLLPALAYFANHQPDPPPPSTHYLELILSGARHWRLPDDYITELERIKAAG